MYTIYYLNDGIYHQQKSYNTLKEAKANFNSNREGYIKNKDGKILKRYGNK